MIEAVRYEDLGTVTALGEAAFEEGLLDAYDPEATLFHWRRIYEMGVGQVWAAYDGEVVQGALGAVAEADLWTGESVAKEVFWYMRPEARGLPRIAMRLLGAYGRWCKDKGYERQYMGLHLTSQAKHLGRLYSRQGFLPTSVLYVRKVN